MQCPTKWVFRTPNTPPKPLTKEAMERFFLKMRKTHNLTLTPEEEKKLEMYNAAREEKCNESILTISSK